jgi:hypothetical protein
MAGVSLTELLENAFSVIENEKYGGCKSFAGKSGAIYVIE